MKILQINKFYYPFAGPEYAVLKMEKLFAQNGHQPIIFSMQHPSNWPNPYSKYFVSNVDYKNIEQYGLLKKIKFGIKLIYSVEARKKLKSLLDNERPDIAHLHNIYHQLSPSILPVLKKYNIPVIMTLHDYKLICPSHDLIAENKICERCKGHKYYSCFRYKCVKDSRIFSALNMIEAYVHHFLNIYDKHIDRYIAPSNFLKQKFIEYGFNPEKITVVPTFVELPKGPQTSNPDSYVVSYGLLKPFKGIMTLIKAMRNVKGELWITGDGEDRGRLEKYVRENNVANVKLLGYVKRDYLEKVIRESALFVIPSEWYENCPATVLEAYGYGKPVIGSRIGGIPEQIREGETGLLFNPGDPEDLAEKINSLLGDHEAIETMGKNARKLAESEYSPEKHYTRLMQVYHELVDEKT